MSAQTVLPRRVEDDPDDAQSIPFRDNFTADRACHDAGPAAVSGYPMIAVAVMGTIALCAGGHAVITPASPSGERAIVRIRGGIKDLRADARSAALAYAAAPQVPIHKTNDDQ